MSDYDDLKRALSNAESYVRRIRRGDPGVEQNARNALGEIDNAKRSAERLEGDRDDYERKYRRSRTD